MSQLMSNIVLWWVGKTSLQGRNFHWENPLSFRTLLTFRVSVWFIQKTTKLYPPTRGKTWPLTPMTHDFPWTWAFWLKITSYLPPRPKIKKHVFKKCATNKLICMSTLKSTDPLCITNPTASNYVAAESHKELMLCYWASVGMTRW